MKGPPLETAVGGGVAAAAAHTEPDAGLGAGAADAIMGWPEGGPAAPGEAEPEAGLRTKVKVAHGGSTTRWPTATADTPVGALT